jgi:hypothetical protein
VERNELVGAVCAVLAISIVAWLSHESWAIADCRELLKVAEFERVSGLEPGANGELSAFRAELEAGRAGSEASACVARIGLPF